jgi:hypothetical protein
MAEVREPLGADAALAHAHFRRSPGTSRIATNVTNINATKVGTVSATRWRKN